MGRVRLHRRLSMRDRSGPLPASYKAYLLMAGRRPPRGWLGTDCTVGELADVRVWAEEVLRENGQPPLPAQAFVFMMHQGYQFYYFRLMVRTMIRRCFITWRERRW